jgi:glycosyltransferase involved in cell wall biosynthesis
MSAVGASTSDSPRGQAAPESTVPVTFISNAEYGGAEEVLLSVIDGLGPDWVGSAICLGDGPLVPRLRERGLSVATIPARRRLGLLVSAYQVRRILRREGTEIVHANLFQPALVAVLATLLTRRRVVWHKHDRHRDGWAARLVARRCQLIVGVSESVNETFRGRVRRKLRVVYNGVAARGVDRGSARRAVTELLGCRSDAEIVAIAARLSPSKGQLDLLNAAAQLIGTRPRLRVAIAGEESPREPGYESVLRGRADALGLEGAVSFLGQLPSAGDGEFGVLEFIGGCDLLAAPSRRDPQGGWTEGFGLTPLEAMAVGTPVVAYRHGSFPEILGDCAGLVPEGDERALADEIDRVLSDDELRARLIECGFGRVRRYRPEVQIAEMKCLYLEAVR